MAAFGPVMQGGKTALARPLFDKSEVRQMLKELKNAMRITISNHDALLANFLMAGLSDLKIAGVVTTETVSFTIGTNDVVTDESTMEDPKLKQAVLTYAAAAAERFWNGPSAEALRDAYEEQKGQLMHATGYTNYGEDGDGE